MIKNSIIAINKTAIRVIIISYDYQFQMTLNSWKIYYNNKIPRLFDKIKVNIFWRKMIHSKLIILKII